MQIIETPVLWFMADPFLFLLVLVLTLLVFALSVICAIVWLFRSA